MKMMILFFAIFLLFQGQISYANNKRPTFENTSKIIDLIRSIEISKRGKGIRLRLSEKLKDFLYRKLNSMNLELEEFQEFIYRNRDNQDILISTKKILFHIYGSEIVNGKQKIIKEIFSSMIKLQFLPNNNFKITMTDVLNAVESWDRIELRQLSIFLKKSLNESISENKEIGKIILNDLHPSFKEQFERKCL